MKSIPISIPNPPSPHNSPNWGSKRARSDETAEENSDTDESIWRRLPHDLIILILSHLPIPSIFRAALLSKSLNSIFSSPYFVKLHSEIRSNSRPPWFLFFSDRCVAHDASLGRWIDLSSRLRLRLRLLPSSLVRPLAAGDGLVTLLHKDPSGVHLYVSNPITNSHRKIPTPASLFRYFYTVSGLVADRATGSFRLALVGSEQITGISEPFVLSAEVFDSGTGSWVTTRSFPVSSPVSPWRAISGDVLYCVLYRYPASVVALDTKLMVWSVVEAPLPPSLTVVRIMDRNGKLVLIGGVGSEGITEEIGVWQLGGEGREWEVIGWLGKEFCEGFLGSRRRLFGCLGGGDLVYFTGKGCRRVAVYDLSEKFVRFLEPPPRILDPHRYIATGLCFRPRL